MPGIFNQERKYKTAMDSKVINVNTSKEESTDEVDFVPTSAAKKEICVSCKSFNPLKKGFLMRNSNLNNNNHTPKTLSQPKKTSVYGDCEIQTVVKTHISALERLHLFHFPLRRKSEPLEKPTISQSTKESRPRLIKSSSIARLFGNTYSTKKSEESHATSVFKKSNSVSEKFSSISRESEDEFTFRISDHQLSLSESASNLSSLDSSSAPMEKSNTKTFRSFTKSLGKLLRRNSDSVTISAPDPEYKVFYLGNVLTGWAKGEFGMFPIKLLLKSLHVMNKILKAGSDLSLRAKIRDCGLFSKKSLLLSPTSGNLLLKRS